MKIFLKSFQTLPHKTILSADQQENLHESFPPQCQDFNTPMLIMNASVNTSEKENVMKFDQNKERND